MYQNLNIHIFHLVNLLLRINSKDEIRQAYSETSLQGLNIALSII